MDLSRGDARKQLHSNGVARRFPGTRSPQPTIQSRFSATQDANWSRRDPKQPPPGRANLGHRCNPWLLRSVRNWPYKIRKIWLISPIHVCSKTDASMISFLSTLAGFGGYIVFQYTIPNESIATQWIKSLSSFALLKMKRRPTSSQPDLLMKKKLRSMHDRTHADACGTRG